eukprot:m.131502 g.131502  ORF g.131502 m.131502 type:complete len:347 (+) comp11314_c0_seq2:3943-4983(+)
MRHGVASGTSRRFDQAQKDYGDFCTSSTRTRRNDGALPVPDEASMVLFATWLSECKGNSPSVVKQKLSSVSVWVMQQGFPDPRRDGQGRVRPALHACLRGIARMRSTVKRIREPITTDRLARLVLCLQADRGTPTWDKQCLEALLCLGVFGLCRVGELVSASTGDFDGETTLRACDVEFGNDWRGPRFADVRIRASKTDVFRRGTTIRLFASGSPLCPVSALERFSRSRMTRGLSSTAPFFVDASGRYITRGKVTSVIKQLASSAGFDASRFASHSMRAGGATTLASLGYDTTVIQKLGRWSSDAFATYISVPDETRFGVVPRMASLRTLTDSVRRSLWLKFRETV